LKTVVAETAFRTLTAGLNLFAVTAVSTLGVTGATANRVYAFTINVRTRAMKGTGLTKHLAIGANPTSDAIAVGITSTITEAADSVIAAVTES